MTEQRQEHTPQDGSRIPEFRTREEEAEFWDTNDVTDFLDEFRPVHVSFAPNLSAEMTVRLDPDDQ